MGVKKMTAVEKIQWDNLYQYVRSEILMYDKSQIIPPNLVLRLKGLRYGKYIENKAQEDRADYSYEIILYAFQISKPAIMNAMQSKTFESEMQKFNYICKIVESNINDVYIRLNKTKTSIEKTESVDTGVFEYEGGSYIQKTTEIKNPKLEDLW